jgi:hypothetical protein
MEHTTSKRHANEFDSGSRRFTMEVGTPPNVWLEKPPTAEPRLQAFAVRWKCQT